MGMGGKAAILSNSTKTQPTDNALCRLDTTKGLIKLPKTNKIANMFKK
jgi:hypothetical protein